VQSSTGVRRHTAQKLARDTERSGRESKMVAQTASSYTFTGGFPSPETVQRAYDDADLNRAIQTYRFFYPTVSGLALFNGNLKLGLETNTVFGAFETYPRAVGFTYNSDTPYAMIPLDLRTGPLVVELPPGPLICVAVDLNQHWVADMGLPGPDAGQGGRHLLLPPNYAGDVPADYHTATSTTYRVLTGARSLPVGGDMAAALARLRTVKVRPLTPPTGWQEPTWVDLTEQPQDTTPLAWEDSLQFWQALHEVVDSEPPLAAYHTAYGELAALGIAKGKPFAPDARMRGILERAAQAGNAQMRVQSFADRRSDRIVWPDRQWEWAALRFEDGDFNTATYLDTDAREKWFYQAVAGSPAMFHRGAGSGSLYWLGLRDQRGGYLDGGNTYRLQVPQPVPGRLFWSVTVYDAETRSQIQTDQGKAALRSLVELRDTSGSSVDLYFGPSAPAGQEGRWIKTIAGKGWFVYFRIYGPEQPAFDGSWKPGDFVVL
jgi:hypothetical protein